MAKLLIVPGHQALGEGHWQTLWLGSIPEAHLVELSGWKHPNKGEWVEALDDAIADCGEPPILVGHALGCLAFVHWAAEHEREIRGALLVAPYDVERRKLQEQWHSFMPIPRSTLAFPAIVVASSDDPNMRLDRARSLAAEWGARFVSLGACGSVDQASGHGPWPRGQSLLAELR
jgi:predicted alpha/beta hydrolase family esterase